MLLTQLKRNGTCSEITLTAAAFPKAGAPKITTLGEVERSEGWGGGRGVSWVGSGVQGGGVEVGSFRDGVRLGTHWTYSAFGGGTIPRLFNSDSKARLISYPAREASAAPSE